METQSPLKELISCNEIQIHYKRELFESMPHIENINVAHTYLKECIDLNRIDHVEFFWALYLTNSNRLIALAEIGIGTSNQVCVSLKSIIQKALLTNATGIIVAHNHPSGTLQASEADLSMTKKITQACKFFDIKLIDHIIITSEGFLSFANENIL